jgi:HK97 family phage major capsid protein
MEQTMETIVGSKRLDWLRRQRDSAASDIETITTRAVDEDRDLTDAENSTCEARRSRIESLDAEIEVETNLVTRSANYETLVAGIGQSAEKPVVQRSAVATVTHEYKTPGDYLCDYLTRSRDPEAAKRFDLYLRAVAHQTTGDNPGILPVPILEPVFIQATQRRPAIEATTRRSLPSAGKQFIRPRITQHTAVGPQTAEKTELPSQSLLINPINVSPTTYGGVVNLSWQNRDWTEPAIMNLIVSDLAGMYAKATDAAFCTYFVGAVTGETELAGTAPAASGGDWLSAIYTASAAIYGTTNAVPDTLWASPDVWASLGSMVDGSGRPMFPTVGPNNAMGNMNPSTMGGTVAGIRMVVDGNFPTGTAILGDSTFVETYETVGGQVSAIEPSVLGTQVAFYGYMAWVVLEAAAFTRIVNEV